ncbi:YjjG family noncanonical pyrimidine nucleotidase [Christiangramia salexigens]|uniref:Noncanonical pyrimidine nucleotidase, YjjG family n=1 Tax=Christiangramia salexigens TaxID=1913577 RepID=A0A1L3J7Q9_9FLAO|nr:YjjG family noncanonical pyrimidine nucleotidase [Christiangramia salexigens]APG61143.1 noncanonical pyrimidine nucleotidase, YjjG family [Christiangramia salexigens]
MKLTNINHIFFDLDHTLWDFDKNSELAFREIFANQKLEFDIDEFLEAYVPINFRYWELYRNNSVSKEALRYGRLKESFDALKFETLDSTINEIADDYIKYLPNNNHLLEGSVEVLDYLSKNYMLHIITNGFEEIQQTKMRNSGIHEYFRSITTSEDAGVKKPHPQIFKKALEKGGALPWNSVMIGDNLEADIIGAANYGLKPILIDPANKFPEHDYLRIEKLKELLIYL